MDLMPLLALLGIVATGVAAAGKLPIWAAVLVLNLIVLLQVWR